MIMTCYYIFAFVLVLSFVVLIHEGGHFFVARRCGVKVEEFSLGFGPKLFSIKRCMSDFLSITHTSSPSVP